MHFFSFTCILIIIAGLHHQLGWDLYSTRLSPTGCHPLRRSCCTLRCQEMELDHATAIFVFLYINLTNFLYSNIKKQFQSIFATETQHIILLWLKVAFSWQFWSFFNIIYFLKSRSIGKSVKQCNFPITYYLTNRQLWISKL